MEENIDVMGLVLSELDSNDMWFTTKADPTACEASSYYKLDEYGNPTDNTVKKIVKEVNSLIGDGAVDIYDAVKLWVNDTLVDCKIDYKDNLVTVFQDKPVVDNIEAFENPVQFPKSSKVESKVKKTEGAGAGYRVGGTIDSVKVNSFTVKEDTTENNDYFEGILDRYFTIDCDIDVTIDDCHFSSYEYGGKIGFSVNGKITNLVLVDQDYNQEENEHTEVTNETIEGALEGISFEDVIGAGWVHQTFTGTYETALDGSAYSDLYADNCTITFTDEPVVDFIDKKVSGAMDESTYEVFDENDDLLDTFMYEDEAIEYAKKNNGTRVVQCWHNYTLIDTEGSIDDDAEDGDVVWERDFDKHYKYDNSDEVEESKKVEASEYMSKYDELDGKDKETEKYINTLNEKKHKQLEEFKRNHLNFNMRTKEKKNEDHQKRLDEVNNKSKNLISSMFTSKEFDSDSPQGQIVMRTSEMFNALSDKGYDIEVTFDNGESTSAIQLGKQGGKVLVTITNTDQPLRAFTSGNFEINNDNIKILQDIQNQIEVL